MLRNLLPIYPRKIDFVQHATSIAIHELEFTDVRCRYEFAKHEIKIYHMSPFWHFQATYNLCIINKKYSFISKPAIAAHLEC